MMNPPILARDLPAPNINKFEMMERMQFIDDWRRKILLAENSSSRKGDEGSDTKIRKVNFADGPDLSPRLEDQSRTLAVECMQNKTRKGWAKSTWLYMKEVIAGKNLQ